MRRILILVLLWSMAWLSVPVAVTAQGMSHDVTQDRTVTQPMHQQTDCPTCLDSSFGGGHASCPHAALCLLLALNDAQTIGLQRSEYAVGFASAATLLLVPHAPALDLPPPRIGSAFA